MFNFSKKKKEHELKVMIFKKYFSSKEHKKIIKEAARKSAEDQKALSRKYEEMIAHSK